MFNIIFEIDFNRGEKERNVVYNIKKDSITWKKIFNFLESTLNIMPNKIKLQIGRKIIRGDALNPHPPLVLTQKTHEGYKGDFIIIKVGIINNISITKL